MSEPKLFWRLKNEDGEYVFIEVTTENSYHPGSSNYVLASRYVREGEE